MEGLFSINVKNIVFLILFANFVESFLVARMRGKGSFGGSNSAQRLCSLLPPPLSTRQQIPLFPFFPPQPLPHRKKERKKEKEGGKGTDFIWGEGLYVAFPSSGIDPLVFLLLFLPNSRRMRSKSSFSFPFKQGKKAGGWVGRDLIPSLSSNSGQCPPLSASLPVQSAFTNM